MGPDTKAACGCFFLFVLFVSFRWDRFFRTGFDFSFGLGTGSVIVVSLFI